MLAYSVTTREQRDSSSGRGVVLGAAFWRMGAGGPQERHDEPTKPGRGAPSPTTQYQEGIQHPVRLDHPLVARAKAHGRADMRYRVGSTSHAGHVFGPANEEPSPVGALRRVHVAASVPPLADVAGHVEQAEKLTGTAANPLEQSFPDRDLRHCMRPGPMSTRSSTCAHPQYYTRYATHWIVDPLRAVRPRTAACRPTARRHPRRTSPHRLAGGRPGGSLPAEPRRPGRVRRSCSRRNMAAVPSAGIRRPRRPRTALC